MRGHGSHERSPGESMDLPLLVLVHGWGFDPSIWDEVRADASLSAHEIFTVDLGFRGSASSQQLPADRPLIGVGHSLGFAWLLHQPLQWRGLVSINGFSRFTSAADFPPGVAPRLLARMIGRLQQDPQGVSRDFLRRCGLEDPQVEELDPAALAEGLEWLSTWDLRQALDSFRGPLLALAGADDPIVPLGMSRASFPAESLQVQDGGGHLLPLTHPIRCAEELARFVETLS